MKLLTLPWTWRFWQNMNYEWVRRRKGGTYLLVESIHLPGYRYWIEREPYKHEAVIGGDNL